MAKKLFLFLLIISCTTTTDNLSIETETTSETTTIQAVVKQSLTSEEMLIEIFNAYKTFSKDPVTIVITI